jgi:AraC-like DNA-binding protein
MQRVVLSKEKLRDDGLSQSDVAMECGFSDQSHLTRVFRQTVGVSPGAWRRAFKRQQASIVITRTAQRQAGVWSKSIQLEARP